VTLTLEVQPDGGLHVEIPPRTPRADGAVESFLGELARRLGWPRRGATPTLDDLAADPAKATSLSPSLAGRLLTRAVAVLPLLLGRASHQPEADEAAAPAGPMHTVEQVAEALQVPVAQVYALARRGELPSVQVGKYVRFPVEALKAWQAGQGIRPRAPVAPITPITRARKGGR
jgi:excisionase family DNA binding protein